jgi:hypothetical protein
VTTSVQRQVAQNQFEKRRYVRSSVRLPALTHVDDKDYSEDN